MVDYKYKDLYNKPHIDKQMKIIACDFVGYGTPENKYPAKLEYEGKVYLDAETNFYYKCRKSGVSYTWEKVEHEYELIVFKNSDIDWENFELSESLCSESELRFGCCEASVLKFRIHNTFVSLKNKWITVTEVLSGHTDDPFQFGRYKVFSDSPTADRLYRDVTAYDSMYDIINSSAIDWYNKILPKENSFVTMKYFRTSFIENYGLKQKDVDLVNDNMIVEKTIQVGEGEEIENETEQVSILKESSLSGKDVITAICEINGCFGHIGRDGKFQYIYLEQDAMGIYPSNTLFPDRAPDYLPQFETGHLYPQSPKGSMIKNGEYISANYEDFICRRINKLQIREKENDIGAQWPEEKVENENSYVIEDNFLIYGKSAADLSKIAQNIYEKIKNIVYRPFSAECVGNPCLEVGDPIRISTKYEIIESYILKRTLKGIQALRDSYSSEGLERRSEKVNSVSKSIIQLKGKTNTLERNVEKTISKIEDVEKDVKSEIVQKADEITSTVSGAIEKYEIPEWENITLFGFGDEEDGSGFPYSPGENLGKRYLNQNNGNVYVSRGDVWIYSSTLNTITHNLSSRIEQTLRSVKIGVENKDTGVSGGITVELVDESGRKSTERVEIGIRGAVTFSNLENDGETTINGGNIKTGTIQSINIRNGNPENGQYPFSVDENGNLFTNNATVYGNLYGLNRLVLYNDLKGTHRTVVKLENGDDPDSAQIIFLKPTSGSFLVVNEQEGVHFTARARFEEVLLNKNIRLDIEEGGSNGIITYGPDYKLHDIFSYHRSTNSTHVGMAGIDGHTTTTVLSGKEVRLHTTSGATVTSDKRLKNSFKPLDEFDGVYMDIEPCAFKYNNGTSGRYHFGVTAQNVKESFEKHGYTMQDFGGFVQMSDSPENEDFCGIDDPMGIIYTEFVMWNMRKIQMQQEEIDSIKKEIQMQQEEIEALKKYILSGREDE